MISPVFGWCSMGTHGISRFAHGIAMLDCSDRRSWTAGVWKKTERRNLNGYPLVMTNIAIENDHRNSRFTHWKWWFSIVMLVYRRVCQLMDGGGLKKNKKSSVLKLTHKGIPVRCRLENTACGWHLKPLTFEVHGQGLKVRCGSWRFSWGREIFVLMKFKGKQPLDCWCLTHVNRIKWVECFSSPGTKPWIILVVTSHWIKGSLQATLPSKQQIDDSECLPYPPVKMVDSALCHVFSQHLWLLFWAHVWLDFRVPFRIVYPDKNDKDLLNRSCIATPNKI